tara:strand:- start:1199 stop:3019 length:1821 start_codon:yes stop_codon:yes gene_type:complete
MSKQISYLSRDFESLKSDLKEYISTKYPDFTANIADENSIASLLLDLNATVADTLNFYIDKQFNEMFITTAQETDNIYKLAHAFGYSPNKKQPARGTVTLYVDVPNDTFSLGQQAVRVDLPRLNIYTSYFSNTDSTGTESRYRFLYPVDFNNKTNSFFDNGSITSKFDNGILWSWEATGASTRITAKVPVEGSYFSNQTLGPFLGKAFETINIYDENFYMVHKVYTYTDGVLKYDNYAFNELWFEVDYMVNPYGMTMFNPYTGSKERVQTRRRFIKRNTPQGTSLVFGYQNMDVMGMKDVLDEYATRGSATVTDAFWPLGKRPDQGTKLHCIYLKTTGTKSNLVENKLTDSNFTISYELKPSETLWGVKVLESSIMDGGREEESLEEVRHNVHSVFRNQNRAITADDYINLLERIPSEWGASVFRAGANVRDVTIFKDPSSITVTGSSFTHKEIDLYALKLGGNGKLEHITDTEEQQSISNYINNYRMLTDTIYFRKPEIININVEYRVNVYDEVIPSRAISEINQALREFFDPRNWYFGQPIYYDDLVKIFGGVFGVRGVTQLNVHEEGDLAKTNLFSTRSDIAGSTIIYPHQIYQINLISGASS